MRKRVLVTGHRGFLGSHLTTELFANVDRYEPVFAPLLDLTKTKQVKKALRAIKPDAIVHLAAKAAPATDPTNFPEMVKTNIIGTQNLLSYAPLGCRFINASSIVVYGDWFEDPFSSHASGNKEDEGLRPTSVYGISKTASEALVNYHCLEGLISGLSLRFCAMVGTRLTHGALKDIVRKASDTTQPTLKLMGSVPGSMKPYLHVQNACRVIVNAIDSDIIGQVNVCSTNAISIFTMADLVQSFLFTHYGIPYKSREWSGETFPGDNAYLLADSSLARRELGLAYQSSRDAITLTLTQMQRSGEIKPK